MVYSDSAQENGKADEMTLSKYLEENSAAGVLKVTTTSGKGMVPISDSRIYITKEIDGDKVIFNKSTSDESGISDDIVLPAPPRSASLLKDSTSLPYILYDLEVQKKGYLPRRIEGIKVFDGIKTVINVDMTKEREE